MAKATVHIARVKDALNREAVVADVIDALDALAPAGTAIKRGAKVVIKPNLTADTELWQKGIVTSPYTVEGIVRWAQKAAPAEIVIAEATACGLDNKKAFRVNGLYEVAARTGASVVDLYDEEFIGVPVTGGMTTREIQVARRVMEADFLINVPTMKTHVATGVSLCMKNLKGVLPENEKRRSHFLGVNKFVADLNSIVRPHLSVIDATIAMEGDGPMQGEPVGLGLILAGSDTVATDIIATRVMGLDPWTFKCFNNAKKQDLGVWREEEISLTGIPPDTVRRPFRPASGPFPDVPGVTLIDGGACPGCLDGARIALGRIKLAGLLDNLPAVNIVVGEKGEVTGANDIIIGRCLKRYRDRKHYVPGCPAQVFVIADELRELAGQYRLFGPERAVPARRGR